LVVLLSIPKGMFGCNFIMETIQIKIEFVNIFLLNMRILTECFYIAFQNNFNRPNDHDRYGIGRILHNAHCSWDRNDFT
jgi:hypothetical protein